MILLLVKHMRELAEIEDVKAHNDLRILGIKQRHQLG